MSTQRAFDPNPEAPAAVRAFVCEFLAVDLSHPVVLVASELAANVVKHAQSRFTLTIAVDETIHLAFEDLSSEIPRVDPSPNGHRQGGRGLWIVDALSFRWGVDPLPSGKRVWAEVARADQLDRVSREA